MLSKVILYLSLAIAAEYLLSSQSLAQGQSDTTTPSPESVCLSPEAQSNLTAGCPQPRNCMFTDPDSCTSFVQCNANPPDGSPSYRVMPCPINPSTNETLFWNDNTVTCESKAQSTCPD